MNTNFITICRQTINRLIRRENLSADDVEMLFDAVFGGTANELSQEESLLLTAFLIALAVKGETVQELVGAARSMRRHARRIQVLGSPVVDIVGTGGDSLHTINVSTTSSFVAAGAGLIVAKHGNRAVSSRCGSADVLETCGVNLKLEPERVEEIIAEIGIGFLFAQQFHPAMRRVAPLRKSLGMRTLFNLLGPLTNPAGASYAVLGVYTPKLTEMFAGVLQELGCRRAMVVYGYDGMDELTLTTRSRVTELFDNRLKTYDFFPELYFDGELATPEELQGGDAAENAEILQGILTGKIRGGKRNIVLLNTAAALVCAEKAKTMENGVRLAAESIDSGAAFEKLTLLTEKTNAVTHCE
ncbi:MAG: anthranilate phosphoribosyltransferase [Planctomycetaceae bacterium]|jgi:anthranilate phosphoribosyltransferase|nr:anthranilate phosphoribosyltransferase [Planctomycetaceae bacterium]